MMESRPAFCRSEAQAARNHGFGWEDAGKSSAVVPSRNEVLSDDEDVLFVEVEVSQVRFVRPGEVDR